MKHVWFLFAGLALLVACGGNAATGTPATAGTTTADAAWACGDRTKLAKELHLFSWADYWPTEDDDNLLADFEQACGVKVTLDTFPSNEELAARIRAGNAGYDIIVPSDYMVDILRTEGRLLRLDKTLLTNYANLDPNQLGLPFDPTNEYSLPFLYGMTGIAYDQTKVSPAPESWAALFDPALLAPFRNRASMLDDEREGVGAALVWRGFGPNTTDTAALDGAKAALLAQKPLLARYDSQNVAQGLASGEIVLAHAWNGEAAAARSENPNIRWILPSEGGIIWQDNLAIPADAPQPYTAHVFLNNVLSGPVAARIADFTLFSTPNTAAAPLIDPAVSALAFPPTAAMRQRLSYIERGSDPALYADVWTQVKGQ